MIPKLDLEIIRNPEQYLKRMNDLIDRVNQASRFNQLVIYNRNKTQRLEIREDANGDIRIIRYNLDGDSTTGSTVVL